MTTSNPTILQNALKITIGTQPPIYLRSSHRHDFNRYVFSNGSYTYTDGGLDYIHRGSTENIPSNVKVEDFSLNSQDNFSRIRARLLWGTRGKSGHEPLSYVRIVDCSTSHLRNILKYEFPLGKKLEAVPLHLKVIKSVLESRVRKAERA